MSETLNFTKLADAELLDSVPENANAFVEVEGTVKRVPGSGLGGDSGIPTAILKLNMDSGDTASVQSLLSGGVATMAAGDNTRAAAAETIYTATCDNMTYDEVKEIFLAGGSVNARLHAMQDNGSQGALCFDSCSVEGGYFNVSGVEAIGFNFISYLASYSGITFYWLPDGTIATDMST